MTDMNPTTSIITLNINKPNTPIKKQRFSDWNLKNSEIQLDAI